MPEPKQNRRELKNTWLEPKVQLRYGMLGFAFVAVAVLTGQALSFVALRRAALRVLAEAGESAGLTETVDLAMRSALVGGLWIYGALAVAALVITARVLHRFIGPQVPVRRLLVKLRNGEYGTTCRIRDRDELHELVADLNDLSMTLQERHGVTEPEAVPEPDATAEPRAAQKRRQAGFSIVEVLAILCVVAILTAVGVSQFLRAYDRSRQRSTMADMRTVASANGTYYVDKGDYATDLESLEPYYLQPVPRVDRWGYGWVYTSSDAAYELTSHGADGTAGPPAPSPWAGDPFDCDLVLASGAFAQAPDI